MTHPQQNRRSFMSVLTSLAGLAAIPTTVNEAAAQVPTASAQNFDLRWIDELKEKHKQVFDMADSDPAAEPPPLRLPRNYLDAFRDLYKLEFQQVRTIVGISGRAFPVNASDRLWEKYAEWSKGQLPPAFNRAKCEAEWKRHRYSNQKLKDRLGWKPLVPTEEGLRRHFEYFRGLGGARA